MAVIWTRINTLLLVLVLLTLVAVIGMLATGVRGGPLDPPGTPSPTDSVRLPGTPISTAPYTISAPGHYYLTRDLTATGGVIALTVNASNVSLDLGGFTIGGDDSVGSWGIYLAGAQTDVRIVNGTVRDFQFGLDAGDDTRIRIDGVHAISNVRGFQLGYRNVLSDCVSMDNTETAIYVPGSSSTIRECVVVLNGGDGVSTAGNANLVEGSRVTGNQNKDIRDTGSIFNGFRDNLAGTIVLGLNGSAFAFDNLCWNPITNPGGNIVGGTDHANVGYC